MPASPLSIELGHLRYFVATAEHGSIRKAGAVLGLDHSAVTFSVTCAVIWPGRSERMPVIIAAGITAPA